MDIVSIVSSILVLGVLGLVFGTLLGFASKKFEVEVDERIPKIKECLPGANCGGCGYPGCEAFATAVVEDGADATLCSVGGSKVAMAIGEIMGVEVEEVAKKTAFIMCNGDCNKRKIQFNTKTAQNCVQGKELMEADPSGSGCTHGCLGLGSCVSLCKFDALEIIDGLAKVSYDKCVNCGACIKACPMGLIESVEENKNVRVACNSKDMGKKVRENCSAGCIGCKICEKNCPNDAIHVVENLAKVDYEKCTACGICGTKCPTKVIKIETSVEIV